MKKEWVCPIRKKRDSRGKLKIVPCIEEYNGEGMCLFKQAGECKADEYHRWLKEQEEGK